MPTNPFGRIGSRGDERDAAEQARALRIIEQGRKRLISTLKGEERAIAGVAAANSAAAQARARDSAAYERELHRITGLLAAQGIALKNLDATRERYHREEMERSESLLQRYEGIKQALREIQQDSDDTTTLLGSIFQPFKSGIDNMLRFGNLPKVTQPIRDTAISFDDVSGSIDRSAGAARDLGRAMVDVAPTVWKYRTAIVDLDSSLKGLKVKYADATDETEKLAKQFIELSRTDIVAPGAVKQIAAVTDSLKYLEGQGVKTETSLQLLVARSRSSGRTFEDSAEDIEQVAAQADILRDSLSDTNTVLQGFAFTVRDDLVRAIADATRNLDSQVISVENVGAAYVYAAKMAAEYGLSAEGAEKVSRAFAGSFFKERDDATGFMAGQILQQRLATALQEAERAMSESLGETVRYASATEEQRKKLEEDAYASIGIEATEERRLAMRQGIGTLGEGLGAADMYNLFAGTTSAIQATLEAQMQRIGISKIDDRSVASRLLSGMNGWNDLSTSQRLALTDMLMSQGPKATADEIAKIQEEAEQRAESTKQLTSSAMTAVLSFKDPIQQLFNIKDFLKSIMLNVSNVVKLLSNLPWVGDNISELYSDITGDVLRATSEQEVARAAALSSVDQEQSARVVRLAEATTALATATTEEQRAKAQETIQSLRQAISQDDLRTQILKKTVEDHDAFIERHRQPSAQTSMADQALDFLSSLVEDTPLKELGRSAGLSFASRTSEGAPKPDPRTAFAKAQTGGAKPPPGEMEAAGSGEVTVDASGESVMVVRMRIRNMGEVIAHHNSTEGRILDQFGLGG